MATRNLLPPPPSGQGRKEGKKEGKKEGRKEGGWILEERGLRPYLPSLLRILRDADDAKVGREGGREGGREEEVGRRHAVDAGKSV